MCNALQISAMAPFVANIFSRKLSAGKAFFRKSLEVLTIFALLLFSQSMHDELFCVLEINAFSKTQKVLLALTLPPEPCSVRVWPILEILLLAGRFGHFPKWTRLEQNTALGVKKEPAKRFMFWKRGLFLKRKNVHHACFVKTVI